MINEDISFPVECIWVERTHPLGDYYGSARDVLIYIGIVESALKALEVADLGNFLLANGWLHFAELQIKRACHWRDSTATHVYISFPLSIEMIHR